MPERVAIQLLGGRKLRVGTGRKPLYLIDWSRKHERPRGSSRGNEQLCEEDTLQFRVSVVEEEPSIQLNYDLEGPEGNWLTEKRSWSRGNSVPDDEGAVEMVLSET